MPAIIEIFCCYAREDQEHMKRLGQHLIPLQKGGFISLKSDADVSPGKTWQDEIKKYLDSANIILLLISADFLASYYYSDEMIQAIQHQKKRGARVIPIILCPTGWEDTPFFDLQALPTNKLPVTSWQRPDEAFTEIVKGIKPIVAELLLPHYVRDTDQLVNEGRFEDAWILYKNIQTLKPTIEENDADHAYFHTKARVLRGLKYYDESLIAYNDAIRLKPSRKRSRKGKAELLLQLGRYTDALIEYEHLIKLDAQNAEYPAQKAFILHKLNRLGEALESYTAAAHFDPKNAEYYFNMGAILLKLGRVQEAASMFEQAIILGPSNALYQRSKGKALLKLKRFEEALAAYENSINLSQDANPYQFHGKGQALVGLERYQEALSAFDEAIRLSGDIPDPQFYHDKGIVYESLAERAYKIEKQIHIKTIPRSEELSLLHTISGFSGYVNDIAISADRILFASGANRKIIKSWDLMTGQELRSFIGHSYKVYSIAISPNRKLLVSGDAEGFIKIWDTLYCKELLTTENDSAIDCLTISPNNQLFISANGDHTITVWSLITGQKLGNLTGHSNSINSLAVNTDGQFLASGSADKTIRVWNLHNGKLLYTFKEHSDEVSGVAISPNGQLLFSGSLDQTIKVWNLYSGQLDHILPKFPGAVFDITTSLDGQILACGIEDEGIRLWDMVKGYELRTLRAEPKTSAVKVLFSPDGQVLASNEEDRISIWGKN